MDVGLRGNRAVLLQQFISQGDHTLRPGFEFWITGASNLWIPATSPSDSKIVVNNASTNALTITANGGTPIFGVARSSGTALPGGDRVQILPGQQGSFVMSDRGWIAQGCERPVLVFTYNGTPLANNPSNPDGSPDLMSWLGLQAGGGTWQNPAGTSQLTATGRTAVSWSTDFSILTNRQVSSNSTAQNMVISGVATSAWVGWRVTGVFTPSGFWLQTQGVNNTYHPRAFTLRVGTTTELLSTTTITGLPAAQSWSGQTQITGNGAYFFFPVSASLSGNTFVLQFTANGSSNEDFNAFQEFAFFGSFLP